MTQMTYTFKDKLTAWLELTRFDKPVGTELLLYPTLWAIFLAAAELGALPSLKIVVIFSLGAIFMRASGCAINDFADRKMDGAVKRTRHRPLPSGRLSAKTAILTFVGLSLLSASLLFFLPMAVFYWSLVAVALAFVYPFMKRFTHLPQVVLAAAFGWAIPMAYVAIMGQVSLYGWMLFMGYMCWTVAYDTQYAMCDRDDDIHVGIKSTAILFGRFDLWMIGLFQCAFIVLTFFVLMRLFGVMVFFVLSVVLAMFAHQARLTKHRERLDCFAAFKHNVWVGRVLCVSVVLMCFWHFG